MREHSSPVYLFTEEAKCPLSLSHLLASDRCRCCFVSKHKTIIHFAVSKLELRPQRGAQFLARTPRCHWTPTLAMVPSSALCCKSKAKFQHSTRQDLLFAGLPSCRHAIVWCLKLLHAQKIKPCRVTSHSRMSPRNWSYCMSILRCHDSFMSP